MGQGREKGWLRSVTGELSEARLRTLSRRVDVKAAVCPFPKRFFGVAGLQQIVARKIKQGTAPRANACRFYTCRQILRRASPGNLRRGWDREKEGWLYRSEEKKGSWTERVERYREERERTSNGRRKGGGCKKNASADRGVLTRALTELSSGEIKNDMHGWTVDFRVDPKKKKENAEEKKKSRKVEKFLQGERARGRETESKRVVSVILSRPLCLVSLSLSLLSF